VRLDVDVNKHDVKRVGHGQRLQLYRETRTSGGAS
jgi:hypothetical protein